MEGPDFDTNNTEFDIIGRIVDRAISLQERLNLPVQTDKMSRTMDLIAANNSCPLKLVELLEAKDGDFAHDVFGITRHINRETGDLGDCFLPRYSRA